jgi:branched-chain amino acid transport system substrate-binding protein
MKYLIGLILATFLVLGIALSGCVENQEETIKIGFVGPLSGDLAMYGQSAKAAMQYAAENLNNEINDKKIELFYEDGLCSGEGATKAYNKLVNVDDVDFIIGGLCSSETLAGASIVNNAKVIAIAYGSTSPELKNAGSYVFTLDPLDDFEGKFDAEYVYNELGIRKVAMLTCLSEWCKGLEDTFKETFENLGGRILIIENNEQNASDLKTQLSKIKTTSPELIFAVQYETAAQNLFMQAEELDIGATIFLPSILDTTLIEAVGKASEGHYTARAKSIVKDPNFESALKRISGLETVDYDFKSPKAYDAILLIKEVIEKTNSFDNEVLKDVMLSTKLNGVGGSYEFNKFGTPSIANYVVEKVINGELVEQ